MATSKTLNPTNVSISIPALGDAPDASVFSNCIDKEADAINTLNSQIVSLLESVKAITKQSQSSTTITFTFTGNRYTALVFRTDNSSGASGIYALHYKKGGVQGVSVIIGNSTTPTIDSSTGTISVTVNSWSKVVLLGFADDNTAFS